jgi:hypothetical protein
MFYVKELFSIFNYNITKVIMKATNTSNNESNETIDRETNKSEPLLKTEEIALRFTGLGNKIDTYTKYAASVKITGEDTLMVAENTSSEMLELEKNIENTRKIFKDPYLLTSKEIDAYAKLISEPISKSRSTVNSAISNYKTVQASFAREKADKEQQELKKIEETKLEEIERITRIEQQLNARIYGGYWINKSGLRQTSAGCINEDQCDDIIILISEKVPKPETYTYYGVRYEEMLKGVKKRLAEHTVNVHNMNSDSKILRGEAMEKISSAKVAADVKAVETKEKGEKLVEKETKKEEKIINNVVTATRKGLKKILKFIVVEPSKVGSEFWIIDEEKIRYYMNQHNEEIKEALLANKESLSGIKFYIDENYASQ